MLFKSYVFVSFNFSGSARIFMKDTVPIYDVIKDKVIQISQTSSVGCYLYICREEALLYRGSENIVSNVH